MSFVRNSFKSSLKSNSNNNSDNGSRNSNSSSGFFSAVRAKLRKATKEQPPAIVHQSPQQQSVKHLQSVSSFTLPPLPALPAQIAPPTTLTITSADHYRYQPARSISLSGDSAADEDKEHRSGSQEREWRGGTTGSGNGSGSSSLYTERVTRSNEGSTSGFDEIDGLHTSRSGTSGSTDEDADSEWSHSGGHNSHAARRARELKEDRERWARFEAAGRTFDDNEPPILTTGCVPPPSIESARSSVITSTSITVSSGSISTSSNDTRRRRKHQSNSNDDIPSAAARNGKKSRKGPGNRSPGGCDYVAKQLASLVIQNHTNKDLNGSVIPSTITSYTTTTTQPVVTSAFADSHPFGFTPSSTTTTTNNITTLPAYVASGIAQLATPTPTSTSAFFSSPLLTSPPAFTSMTLLPSSTPSSTSTIATSVHASPIVVSAFLTKPQAVNSPTTEHSTLQSRTDAWQMEGSLTVTSPNALPTPAKSQQRRARPLASLTGSGMMATEASFSPSSSPSNFSAPIIATAVTTSKPTVASILRRQKAVVGVLLDPLQQRPSSPSLTSHQVDGANGRSRSPSSTRYASLIMSPSSTNSNSHMTSPSAGVITSSTDGIIRRLRRTNASTTPFQEFNSPVIHVGQSTSSHIIPARSSDGVNDEHLSARSIDSRVTPLTHHNSNSGNESSHIHASSMPTLDLRKCHSMSFGSPRSEISDNGLSSPISKVGMTVSISGTSALSSDRSSHGGCDNASNCGNESARGGERSRPSSSSSCRPMQRSRSPSSTHSTSSTTATSMTHEPIITSTQGRAHKTGSKRNSGGAAGLIAAVAALPPLKFAPKRPGTAAKSTVQKKAPFNSPRPNGQSGPFNSPRPANTSTQPSTSSTDNSPKDSIMTPVEVSTKPRTVLSFFR